MKCSQAGFTLIEMVVAVGIVSVLTFGVVGFSLSSHPYEISAATQRFDALIDTARTTASAYGDGATIFVTTGPTTSSFRAQLYAHRPGNPSLAPVSGVAPVDARVGISESTTLKNPAFALVLHGSGAVGGRANFTASDRASTPETPCPASGAFIVVFQVGTQRATRSLPCQIDLTQTGPAIVDPSPGPGASPIDVAPTCITPAACAATPPPAQPLPTCPPTGATRQGGNACRYPMNVSPLQLQFVNPSDTNPQILDGNGIGLGTRDAGGLVHVAEQFFNATYSVDDTQCQPLIQHVASPLAIDSGGGDDFAIQTLGTPNAYGQCALSISDGNGQVNALSIIVEQALQVSPNNVRFANAANPTCTYPDLSQHNPCIVSVSKWGYNPPNSFTIDDSDCRNASEANANTPALLSQGQISTNFIVTPLQSRITGCGISILDGVGENATVIVKVDAPPCPNNEAISPAGTCQIPWTTIQNSCDDAGRHYPRPDVWALYVGTPAVKGILSYQLNKVFPAANGSATAVSGYGFAANTDYSQYFTNSSWPQFYFAFPQSTSGATAYLWYANQYVMAVSGVSYNPGLQANSGVAMCIIRNGLGYD